MKKRDLPKHRNPVASAMFKRHGTTTTIMKDRRERRAKDARNRWDRDEW